MNTGRIVIYEQFEDISPLVTFVQSKDIFISGDFVKIPYALIAVQKNAIEREEIESNKINSMILEQDTVLSFAETNNEALAKIHNESLTYNYDLSWLQAMQIFSIQQKTKEDLLTILQRLEKFYSRHLNINI